jgi:hypothetical protein
MAQVSQSVSPPVPKSVCVCVVSVSVSVSAFVSVAGSVCGSFRQCFCSGNAAAAQVAVTTFWPITTSITIGWAGDRGA